MRKKLYEYLNKPVTRKTMLCNFIAGTMLSMTTFGVIAIVNCGDDIAKAIIKRKGEKK